MADTSVLSGLDLTKWGKEFMREYVRDSGFEPYMGDSPMDIIHVKNELRESGYTVRVPLLTRLNGNGVSGNTRLGGSEEDLSQYYVDVVWEYYRNGVQITKKELEKAAPDMLSPVRPMLKEWASELVKYQLVEEFHNINGTAYASVAEATKDTWLANNADRVIFGAAVSNNSSNDHSSSLANIDSTNDKLTPELITLAKMRARLANPIIRPFKTGTQGREFYVLFAHPYCFRDLKQNSTMTAANRDARAREVGSNPLFQDGDLIWDGVIIREIPEFYRPRQGGSGVNTQTHLASVGASSIDVGVNFLCGAQAIAFVNKQLPTPTEKKEDDYGFLKGIGIELAHGLTKIEWANGSGTRKDVGIHTIYASAA
jgi:N4-gp56 family major capsid protein